MNGRQLHRLSTLVLSLAMVAIGLALIVRSLSEDAGALSVGLLAGVLFIAAGAGRTWVERRRGRGT
jgi:uncharacterized membrane protein YadS